MEDYHHLILILPIIVESTLRVTLYCVYPLSFVIYLSVLFLMIAATCGEDVNGPELYCKLVGSSASSSDPSEEYNIIKGQVNYAFNSFIHR